MTASLDPNTLKEFQKIDVFVRFARRNLAEDPEYWKREAQFGEGIFQVIALAVIEIGGGSQRDP